jgi:peptide/nickel transport system ATP-binding protein
VAANVVGDLAREGKPVSQVSQCLPDSAPVLVINGLHVHFYTYSGITRALNGISLSVRPGEMSAIVGESGSGKSVLAWTILGLTKPPGKVVAGEILWRDENILTMSRDRLKAVRGRELGLIVSSPRSHLHPLTRVGHQIEAVYAAVSESRGQAREATVEILKAVEMPDPWRIYQAFPHELSGGMAQRVLIAMALINSPELVVADDATNALDVTVQRQVLDLMTGLIRRRNASALMITHDLGIVAQYCQRATVIHSGQVYESADTQTLFANPVHPYTKGLIAKARRRKDGQNKSDIGRPTTDQSVNTCPDMQDCREAVPELEEVEPGHLVRPWRKSWTGC